MTGVDMTDAQVGGTEWGVGCKDVQQQQPASAPASLCAAVALAQGEQPSSSPHLTASCPPAPPAQ